MHPNRRRAFTLIELVAVVVVLAVLAGVAVPKYFDHAARARTSAALGALGGVRTALNTYMLNAAATGTPAYPTATQLAAAGTVLPQGMPRNPYNSSNTIRSVTTAAIASARTVDGTQGWAYFVDNSTNPPTATIYLNSTTATTVTAVTAAGQYPLSPNGSFTTTSYLRANNL